MHHSCGVDGLLCKPSCCCSQMHHSCAQQAQRTPRVDATVSWSWIQVEHRQRQQWGSMGLPHWLCRRPSLSLPRAGQTWLCMRPVRARRAAITHRSQTSTYGLRFRSLYSECTARWCTQTRRIVFLVRGGLPRVATPSARKMKQHDEKRTCQVQFDGMPSSVQCRVRFAPVSTGPACAVCQRLSPNFGTIGSSAPKTSNQHHKCSREP